MFITGLGVQARLQGDDDGDPWDNLEMDTRPIQCGKIGKAKRWKHCLGYLGFGFKKTLEEVQNWIPSPNCVLTNCGLWFTTPPRFVCGWFSIQLFGFYMVQTSWGTRRVRIALQLRRGDRPRACPLYLYLNALRDMSPSGNWGEINPRTILGGFKHVLFSPVYGIILTHIFQMGWNHQLELFWSLFSVSSSFLMMMMMMMMMITTAMVND